ncbi:hypothetical protein D3C81_2139910 [compost metagenome]
MCRIADSPRIEASKCGTIPAVQPSAVYRLARVPATRAVEMVRITPLPGISTTIREVMRKSRLGIVLRSMHAGGKTLPQV